MVEPEIKHASNSNTYPADWRLATLGSLASISRGASPRPISDSKWFSSQGRGWVRISDVTKSTIYLQKTAQYLSEEGESKSVKVDPGEIILSICATIGVPIIASIPVCIHDGFVVFKELDESVNRLYLYYYLNSLTSELANSGQPGTQKNLNTSLVREIVVPIPSPGEQKTISDILLTWDNAIEHTQSLIDAKKRMLRGLVDDLLTGSIRFPEFGKQIEQKGDLPDGWKYMKLGYLLKRVRIPVKVEPNRLYREIGIRSHGKGIFHKEECDGKTIGSKQIFKVKPDLFVLNIVFAWEQAVAKTTPKEEGFVASHRFPMYRPLEGVLDLDYLVKYFLTEQGKFLLGLVSPGGAGRNKTLGQDAFLKLEIPVPPLGEQKRIMELLLCLEKDINTLVRYRDALQLQKQSLMQRLLTGEIRVKSN